MQKKTDTSEDDYMPIPKMLDLIKQDLIQEPAGAVSSRVQGKISRPFRFCLKKIRKRLLRMKVKNELQTTCST